MLSPLTLGFAEIEGPFGTFTVSEKLFQTIWHRGDFDKTKLRAVSGKPVECVRTGRWNFAEGPDFIGAELRIAGEVVRGDVELHFYAEDWEAHGHAENPTFDNVVLHVVLFPPRDFRPATTRAGRVPETLILLPFLNEDLESYAEREALLDLEKREKSAWRELLLPISEPARLRLLREKADFRRRQKCAFAKQRLDACGWAEACHRVMLETLGLRRNRAPMAAIAERFSLNEFSKKTPAALFDSQRGRWRLAGIRPANRPLLRLQQYAALLEENPAWPESLKSWGDNLRAGDDCDDAGEFRKAARLPAALKNLAEDVLADAVGGTRLNTLVVDAFLPLLAAGGFLTPEAFAGFWRHWPTGDIPQNLAKALRPLLPSRGKKSATMSNGLFQGVFQLSCERELPANLRAES